MGQLLSDFNEMLSQIETWDLELRRHREQLEQQVTERTRELSAAKVRAESSSLAKSQFLATMSHEIRTPLNGILGMTSLLLDSPLSAQERRFAEDIALSAEALLAVINDVLDFSRLEAGAVKPERLEFDPERIILDVFGLLSIPAREKGLALRLDLPPEAPRTVLGDAGRFRQILLNLVGNAVKFTEAGEVAVAAAPPGTPGGLWTFEVMDTGIGIAPEVLPHLFQPFTQADQSFARRFGGSGLGLSICAKLADLLEGSLEALPRPGGGSIFRLRLPLAAYQDALPAAGSTGKRILLAGRPSPTLDSLLRLLRHLGHTVEAVDAMGSIDAGGQGFALAVLVAESTAADMVAAEAAQWALLGRAGQPRLLVRGGTSGQPAGPPVEPDGGTGVLSLPASRAEIGAAVHRLIGPEGSAAPGRDERSERLNKHALVRTDRPQRILVVDDNSLNREIMAKMLERMGHRADVAQDGAEAVASQQADAYDLILMDCQMPVMDGLEATRRIRALENGAARVPIIALTGNAFDEDRQRCLEAGMDDHLPKPVRLDVLRSTLDRWGTA
jgi:signal transduction histidine kinase/CheY-like chemotaxis protein